MFLLLISLKFKTKKEEVRNFLHIINGGATVISSTFRIGYTYHADCKSFLTSKLINNPCPHSPDFFTVHLSYISIYLFHVKS